MTHNPPHIPVLLEEIIAHTPATLHRMVDGTLGAGGHSAAMLQRYPALTLLGLDLDPDALTIAQARLAPFSDRAHVVHGSYADAAVHARHIGWQSVDFILLDLGVSSMQVDRAERGFTFMQDGPLDMRFNPTDGGLTAQAIVNGWDEAELTEIFFQYGEERFSRRIAQNIIKNRPLHSTAALAQVVAQAIPNKHRQNIHPATRVFQALRIAVNDELGTIEQALPAAIDLLTTGGRLAVISFHSLEDRIVKQVFKQASMQIVSPPGMMLEEKTATVRLVTRKPITATDAEIADNPRSRSAKLRVIEKL